MAEKIPKTGMIHDHPAGFTPVPNEISADRTLSASARHLWTLLTFHSWRYGVAFPGIDFLAWEMAVTKPTLYRFLDELKDAGLLEVKRRGLGRTNLYKIKAGTPQQLETYKAVYLKEEADEETELPEVTKTRNQENNTPDVQNIEHTEGQKTLQEVEVVEEETSEEENNNCQNDILTLDENTVSTDDSEGQTSQPGFSLDAKTTDVQEGTTSEPSHQRRGNLTQAEVRDIGRAEQRGLTETLELIVEHGGRKARVGTKSYAKVARAFLKDLEELGLDEIHLALKFKLASAFLQDHPEYRTPTSLLRPGSLPEWFEKAEAVGAEKIAEESSPDGIRKKLITEVGQQGLDRLKLITSAQGTDDPGAHGRARQAEAWFADRGIKVEVRDGIARIVGRL